MTAAKINYARTDDGVSIAYATRGEGPLLLAVENLGLSNTSLALAEVGGFLSALASQRTVITFDPPGVGLSDAAAVDMSVDAQVGYLSCMVGALGGGPLDVYGWGPSAAPAVAFAARHPDLVRRLVLGSPCARTREMDQHSPLMKTLRLASADFGFFVTTILSLLGVPAAKQTSLAQTLISETSPDVAPAWLDAVFEFDASGELEDVRCPTLVLQPTASPLVPARHVALIAARIPGASLAPVGSAPAGGMIEESLGLVGSFLGGGREADSVSGSGITTSALRIVVFTDIQDHTDMMQQLGDERGREVLRAHERITRESLRAHGGAVVKEMGDGFMASFNSAQSALGFAIDLQRRFAAEPGRPMLVRVGINAGEPISDEEDLFGASVIIASRVAAQARGGEILVSNVVRELVIGKGFLFSERGFVPLKGFDEPVRLFELRWSETAHSETASP